MFPVTRVEAVLARGTTLDKVLAEHDEQILELRNKVKNIGRVDEKDIQEIVDKHWGPAPNGGTSPDTSEGGD